MATIEIKLSDAAIKKALENPDVTEISGAGLPFMLRPHKDRKSASWYIVSYKNGKTRRNKLANWPDLNVKQLIEIKNELIGKLAQECSPTLNDWLTVGELLSWYLTRTLTDRSLSKRRKADIKSSIEAHLLPKVGSLVINEITKTKIDEYLIWPLQKDYQISTTRQHFALLKRAFNQAYKLNRLASNPLSSMVFTDFITTPIKAKSGVLKSHHLPDVVRQIKQSKPFHKTFVVIMLGLGTRIGETRQLRWDYFDVEQNRLIIPEKITKTGEELILPITSWMQKWLEQHKFFQSLWGYTGPFLFSNPSRRGPINEDQANDWVKKVSNREWTAHDLRKLARSSWADLGVDYMVGEMLLNHKMSKLDEAYIHTYVTGQKRDALTKWHLELEKHFSIKQTDTTPTRKNSNEPEPPFIYKALSRH